MHQIGSKTKYCYALIILSILFIFVAQAPKVDAQVGNANPDLIEFNNPAIGVSFQYPSDWVIDIVDEKLGAISLKHKDILLGYMFIGVLNFPVSQQEFFNERLNDIEEDANIISQVPFSLAGYPALKVESINRDDGKPKLDIIAQIKGQSIYILYSGAKQPIYSTILGEVFNIIGTMQFYAPNTPNFPNPQANDGFNNGGQGINEPENNNPVKSKPSKENTDPTCDNPQIPCNHTLK